MDQSKAAAKARALSEVDVLTDITRTTFGDVNWKEPDSANVDVVATLIRLIEKSSFSAMQVFHRLQRAITDAGERRDRAAPGGQAMSAEDAAIVRRIRSNSPDGRYDGGSDAELLDLFKRNKRVLERSDDDVIATMTRQK